MKRANGSSPARAAFLSDAPGGPRRSRNWWLFSRPSGPDSQAASIIFSTAAPFQLDEVKDAAMNVRERWQDIEEIKELKARYIRFGDTKRWDDLATLLTQDFAALFEIAPRFGKDQPRRVEISGRDPFIN